MNDDDAFGKVFAELFDKLDFVDKVQILQYMNELTPTDRKDKVVAIDAYRRPGKEIEAHGSKRT